MSKATHDAVEEAIRAHITVEGTPAHTIKGLILHFLDRFRHDDLIEGEDE